MVTVHTLILMEQNMRVSGGMIFSMDLGLKYVSFVFNLLKGCDGSKYEGIYKDGKKHGKGKYVWNDENSYDGDWVENRITGKVLLICITRVIISGLTDEFIRGIG